MKPLFIRPIFAEEANHRPLAETRFPGLRWALCLGMMVVFGSPLQATYDDWNGSTSTDWSISSNWSAGVPGASDTAVFNSTFGNQPTLFSSPGSIGGIWDTGSLGQNVIIAGSGTLAIEGNLLAGGPGGIPNVGILLDDAGNFNLNINTTLQLNNSSSFLVNNSAALTLSGAINLAPGTTLTLGSGSAAGTGIINFSGNIGATSAGITVNDTAGTATVALTGTDVYSGATLVSAGRLQLDGSITNSSVTVDGSSAQLFEGPSGSINGAPSLTVTSGTATLFGSNTYSGITTVNGGLLNINNASALGSGSFVVGSTSFATTASIDNTSGAAIIFPGMPQTWDGDFTFVGTNDLTFGSGSITLGVTAGTQERTVNVVAGNLTENGAISDGTANTLIFRSVDTSSVLGGGALTLNSPSTYTGGTQILNGRIITNSSTALGSGQVALAAFTPSVSAAVPTLQVNAALQLDSLTSSTAYPLYNVGALYTVAPQVQISGGGGTGATAVATILPSGALVVNITNAGSNYTSVPTFTFVGGEYTGAAANFAVAPYGYGNSIVTGGPNLLDILGTNPDPATFTGDIIGGLSVQKDGPGTQILASNSNYNGSTTVNQGTLTIEGANTTSSLTVASGATFNYDPVNFMLLSLTASSGTALDLNNANMGFEIGGTGSQVGTILVPSGTFVTASGTININILASGTVTAGSFPLINVPGGSLSGASYVLGTVYNNTNFTVTGITATSTLVSLNVAAAPILTNAYWEGGYGPADNVWAASDGSTLSNWQVFSGGYSNTGQVPGSGTVVTFSAPGAANQSSMTLGTSMSINGLIITDPMPVILNPDGNTLTVGGLGITVNTAANDTLGADLAGSAFLTTSGIGTLTLLGTNSYTGMTTIAAGGTLQIGNGGGTGTLGAAPVLDNGNLIYNRYGDLTVIGPIMGSGNVSSIGTGVTTVMPGANNYTGKTTIDNGILDVAMLANGGSPSGIGASSNAASNLIFGNGTLQDNFFSGLPTFTDRLFTIGDAAGNSATLDSSSPAASGAMKWTNSGAIVLVNAAPHTLTLTGSDNLAPNIFVPTLGDQGIFPSSLIKADGSTWILQGNNTYSGQTMVHGGTLQIGDGTSGNIGTGNIIVSPPGIVAFNQANDSIVPNNIIDNGVVNGLEIAGNTNILNGFIGGSGSVLQSSDGTTILTQPENYAGPTTVTDGILNANNLLNTSTLTVSPTTSSTHPTFNYDPPFASIANLTLTQTTGVALTIGGISSIGAEINGTAGLSPQGSIVVQSGAIASTTGNISVNVYGSGFVNPPGTFVLLSSPGAGLAGGAYTLGTVYNNTNFTVNPTLVVTPTSVSVTTIAATALTSAYWTGIYAASNDWAATDGLTISNWSPSSSGGVATPLVPGSTTDVFFQNSTSPIRENTGTLGSDMNFRSLTITDTNPIDLLPDGHTLSVGTGNIIINTIANDTFEDALSGAAALNMLATTSGTVTLTAANSYTGTTNILGGILQLGNGGLYGSLSPLSTIFDNANFTIDRSNTITQGVDFSPTISGTGSVTQAGTGTTILNGPNIFTGATMINSGILEADGPSLIGTNGPLGLNSAVTLANVSGANLDITASAGSVQIGSLAGGGTLGGNVSLTSATLITGANNASTTFDGVISGPGSIQKIGMGVQTLTADNTFTGPTAITGGASILITGGFGTTPATTTITGSAIDLGTTGQLSGSPQMKIMGGSMIFGGVNNAVSPIISVYPTGVPADTNTIVLNGSSQTFGALTLVGASGNQTYIDLTHGGLLTLQDVGAWTAGTILDIVGWQGPNVNMGDSTHQIDLGTLAIMDLTPAELASVTWIGVSIDGGLTYGNITGAQISGTELTPVPEPGTILVSLCLVGLLGWNGRRWLIDQKRFSSLARLGVLIRR